MTFLMFLFLIFAGGMLATTIAIKKFKRFLKDIAAPQQQYRDEPAPAGMRGEAAEVLYRSDDMVVMKGEAKKTDKGEKRQNSREV